MSFSIKSTCISCSACEAVCPEDAITLGDDQYEIQPLHCTECGLCLGHCPVEAIISPAG